MKMTESVGSARLEKSGGTEYLVFTGIAQTGAAREGGAVTASAAKGEIEFAAARASAAKDTE